MTDRRRVSLVDAFTDEPMAGNPAGVVPDARGLTEDRMQRIAVELGASETAFVGSSDEADYRLRYFTPEREVDLCGHATIGAFAALLEGGTVGPGDYSVETDAGVLDVEVASDGLVWLTQSPPAIREVDLAHAELAEALGVETAALSEVGADLPIARASTGLSFLVVPVSYFEQLSAVDPDLDAVADLCRRADAEGLYTFTFDTLAADSALHGRAFGPLAGISEDPVTATASGAVGAYLRWFDALDAEDPLVVEQGHFLDRPGRASVETGGAPRVGGHAVVVLEGDLAVPDDGDDDIIEA